MATQRMDVTSFVGKLLEQDDVDALDHDRLGSPGSIDREPDAPRAPGGERFGACGNASCPTGQ